MHPHNFIFTGPSGVRGDRGVGTWDKRGRDRSKVKGDGRVEGGKWEN